MAYAHSQALREVEFLFARRAVCGAEEARLVEAHLLQFLRVLRQSGREEQLLQRHLRRGQTETHKRKRLQYSNSVTLLTLNENE